ncbi:hypothetical protein BDFB_006005 [Asbolus verrucosus]|uniref:Uncharacterized protein n=1 Tax=Asbolus verrucosus TaxID=1661398 RepID=A0A482VV46_ASBVE|nr:hypothetical protein BDFB_006005 [Asbolus verrucosus]
MQKMLLRGREYRKGTADCTPKPYSQATNVACVINMKIQLF